MATNTELVNLALTQDGDPYIFGFEVDLDDPDPPAFDCSEFVQWLCRRLQVRPTMPDGSWHQATHCRDNGTLIPVSQAITTAGALLFRFSSDPYTGNRPRSAHVAISQGDGTTIEARSTRYGLGQFTAASRGWTHAALIPGIAYQETEDDMPQLTDEELKVVQDLTAALKDVQSNGWFAKFLIPLYRIWSGSDIVGRLEALETAEENNTPPAYEARIVPL